MQKQQMLGEVRTVSKKEKRVREVIRDWEKGKQHNLLGGEKTVSEKDRWISGVRRAWRVREISKTVF